MPCPECGQSNLDCLKSYGDGAGRENEEYECLSCGCQWEWSMQRTITEHGTKYNGCENKPMFTNKKYGNECERYASDCAECEARFELGERR